MKKTITRQNVTVTENKKNNKKYIAIAVASLLAISGTAVSIACSKATQPGPAIIAEAEVTEATETDATEAIIAEVTTTETVTTEATTEKATTEVVEVETTDVKSEIAEANAQTTETKPEVKTTSKPEVKSEAKPAVKSETKPESKPTTSTQNSTSSQSTNTTQSNTNKPVETKPAPVVENTPAAVENTPVEKNEPATTEEKTTECAHNWVAQYKTVHHPAQTHTEEQQICVREAWTEEIKGWRYICNGCGQIFSAADSPDECAIHFYNCQGGSSYDVAKIVVDTIEHPAEYETTTVTVTDKEAWDEEVVNGYKCSKCGSVK